MTLPKAPPPRRFHLPPPGPRRDTRARIGRFVRKHEEEERPFDPERAPTWRGSSKDLVVNPGGFERDLESLLHDYYGHLDTELSEEELLKELLTTFRRKNTEDALERANELLDGHGVEVIGSVDTHDGPPYLYINFGDSYSPTIAYSRDDNKVFVAMGGWAELAEENEASVFDEGWDSWLSSDFQRDVLSELEAQRETLGAGSKAYKDAEQVAEFFEGLDAEQQKELFRRAMSRAQGVDGKYPEVSEQSDGSIFVRHLDAVAREGADMLMGGWAPGQWEGHSKRKHHTNARRVRVGPDTYVPADPPKPKFKVGQRVCDLDGARPGEVALIGGYDDYIGGYRYKVQEDSGARIWHNETNMKKLGDHAENPRVRSRFSVDDIVYPRFFIQGYPTGIGRDTRTVVREVRPRDKRMLVVRDDGREGQWWVHFDDMRKQGEPA